MTKLQHDILNILRNDGSVSKEEIAKTLGKTPEEIKKELRDMTDKGIIVKYIAVVNDEKLVEAARCEVEALGYEATREERRPLAEDFGYYTLHYPALFYRLGVGRASGRSHTATYAPSEEALTVGVELMERLARKLIQR